MADTEAIELMVTPGFKSWLEDRAAAVGISVSGLLLRGAELHTLELDVRYTELDALPKRVEESTQEISDALDRTLVGHLATQPVNWYLTD